MLTPFLARGLAWGHEPMGRSRRGLSCPAGKVGWKSKNPSGMCPAGEGSKPGGTFGHFWCLALMREFQELGKRMGMLEKPLQGAFRGWECWKRSPRNVQRMGMLEKISQECLEGGNVGKTPSRSVQRMGMLEKPLPGVFRGLWESLTPFLQIKAMSRGRVTTPALPLSR